MLILYDVCLEWWFSAFPPNDCRRQSLCSTNITSSCGYEIKRWSLVLKNESIAITSEITILLRLPVENETMVCGWFYESDLRVSVESMSLFPKMPRNFSYSLVGEKSTWNIIIGLLIHELQSCLLRILAEFLTLVNEWNQSAFLPLFGNGETSLIKKQSKRNSHRRKSNISISYCIQCQNHANVLSITATKMSISMTWMFGMAPLC